MLAVLSMYSLGCCVLIVSGSIAFIFLLQEKNELCILGIPTQFLPCGF